MRVTAKDINGLKQLDRIEYLLEERKIEASSSIFSLEVGTYVMSCLCAVGIISLLGILRDPSLFPLLIKSLKMLLVIGGIFFSLTALTDIFSMLSGIIKLNKLKEKYFKVVKK